jgi:hypothetical protein
VIARDRGRGTKEAEMTTTGQLTTPDTAVSPDTVWRAIENATFAVLGYVTPAGKPRTSGVMYAVQDRHLYVSVAADSWKARHIHTGDEVSVTVTVHRGGLLALLMPIPPATVTFHARATVHSADTVEPGQVPAQLIKRLPPATRGHGCLIELAPVGEFITYGIGVSLRRMAKPGTARGRTAVT